MKIQAPIFGRMMDVVTVDGYDIDAGGVRTAMVTLKAGGMIAICPLADIVIVGAEVA